MNIEEEEGWFSSAGIERIEIDEIIPRFPCLSSLFKRVRKFHSPRGMEKERYSPLILFFVWDVYRHHYQHYLSTTSVDW